MRLWGRLLTCAPIANRRTLRGYPSCRIPANPTAGPADTERLRYLLAFLLLVPAWAEDLANVIFLEPVNKVDTHGSEVTEKMPLYRKAADPARSTAWLHNASAERAFRLYRAANEIVHPGAGTPDYYVALVEGGNHAAVGFRIQNGDAILDYPRQTYILLDADPNSFETTLLHETGHMAMEMLAGGRQLDGKDIASIPHTTAALTDRTTAFSEGYAIH